ncbi:MAG: 4Fe-4S binding protein [Bacteroidales bacterium]
MSSRQNIAFYSPVPGSGSTLLCRAYADYLATTYAEPVHVISCDFRYSSFDTQSDRGWCIDGPVTVFLPYIDRSQCNLCKACAKSCVFGAIKIESALSYIHLKTDRCRACGACINICRYGAIGERERVIGVHRRHELSDNIFIYEGQLIAEDFFAIPLLQKIISLPPEQETRLTDAYSGINYPALESLHHCQSIVIVIDPSTFSTSYFNHTLTILKKYHKNIFGIINYAGDGNDEIVDFMKGKNIPVIMGFPDLGLLAGSAGCLKDNIDNQQFNQIMEGLFTMAGLTLTE